MVWSQCCKLSKCEKVFFAVVASAALAVLIYEWVYVVIAYVDEPIRSDVFYKEPKSMRFPPLLFCQKEFYLNEAQLARDTDLNPNSVRYMKIVTNPTGSDKASMAASGLWMDTASPQEVQKAQADYLNYVGKYRNNPWAALERVMINCTDMVRQCSLAGQNYTALNCCRQWAVKRLTPVGPCLALQPPDQTVPTSIGAFQIEFNIAPNIYNTASAFDGFEVYIGDTIGKPMSAAFILNDEDSYTIQLSATTYHTTVGKDCDNKLRPSFAGFDLVGVDQALHCASNAVQRLCQCAPVFQIQLDAVERFKPSAPQGENDSLIDSGSSMYLSSDTYRLCDVNTTVRCAAPLLNSSRDMANFTKIAQRFLNSTAPCNLMPPCTDNRYHFAVTEYREMTPTASEYRSRLRMYYESFVVTKVEQRRSYSFHDVIVNMGGSLAFWFVAVHLIMYVVVACKCCLFSVMKKGKNQGMARNRVADIEAPGKHNAGHMDNENQDQEDGRN